MSAPRRSGAAVGVGAAPPLLVVEDNQDAAESLTTLLELWGHEVRVAYDGLAALRLAEAVPPT
jgi:CheY-like chemotaxis protein